MNWKHNTWKHIIGILLFLGISFLLYPIPSNKAINLHNPPFVRDVVSTILLITFFYLNYYFLIQRYYFSKNYLLYFGIIFLCFFIICFLPSILSGRLSPSFDPKPFMYPPNSAAMPPLHDGPKNFIAGYVSEVRHIILLYVVIVFFSLLLRIQQRFITIEKDKKEAEAVYLKEQINPHFLFNTLSSIYALALPKSKEVAEAILHLSDMMRFTITEAAQQFIPLKKELDYLSHYIALQKARFTADFAIDYRITGEANIDNKTIAPLILITFIENAFKHRDSKSDVTIEITIIPNAITLKVQNGFTTTIPLEERSGIGVSNAKQRLALNYPNQHTLLVSQQLNFYTVTLTINL